MNLLHDFVSDSSLNSGKERWVSYTGLQCVGCLSHIHKKHQLQLAVTYTTYVCILG